MKRKFKAMENSKAIAEMVNTAKLVRFGCPITLKMPKLLTLTYLKKSKLRSAKTF